MSQTDSGAPLAGVSAHLTNRRARKSHLADSDADVAVLLHGRPGKFVATKLAMGDLAYEVYEVLLTKGIRRYECRNSRRSRSCARRCTLTG